MSTSSDPKAVIQNFFAAVWGTGNLDALPDFWTADCINHEMPGDNKVGLDLVRAYHQGFLEAYSGVSDVGIDIKQQIAEGDRVMTHMVTSGRHTGDFMGVAATGRNVSLATMRIDRIVNGKIAEHWSVADMAGLMQQLS
jgi:predicted ester cyclase